MYAACMLHVCCMHATFVLHVNACMLHVNACMLHECMLHDNACMLHVNACMLHDNACVLHDNACMLPVFCMHARLDCHSDSYNDVIAMNENDYYADCLTTIITTTMTDYYNRLS